MIRPPKKVPPKLGPNGSKRVTLIGGLPCIQGTVVMFADREEDIGTTKGEIRKLVRSHYIGAGGWSMVIGGAGASAVLDRTEKIIQRRLLKHEFDEEWILSTIEDTVREVFERYVWPVSHQVDNEIALLFCLKPHNMNEAKLFSIDRSCVAAPHLESKFIGIGSELGNYLAKALYSPFVTEKETIKLAAFIAKEVKEIVIGVGKGTDILPVRPYELDNKYIPDQEIASLEGEFTDFIDSLQMYWSDKNKPASI